MAAASNAQVQAFVNDRVRPRCEQIRALLLAMEDDRANIADVYENVNNGSSTWADAHTSNPPHLLSRTDVLAYNTFLANLVSIIRGTVTNTDAAKGDAVDNVSAQLPVILQGCVRGL